MKRIYCLFAAGCCLAMLCIACFANCYGATAGNTMEYFSIGSAQQGLIPTAQAVGGIAVTVLLALFGERFNKLRLCAAGLALLCVASLAVGAVTLIAPAAAGYYVMLALVCLGGVGVSAVDVLVSGVISDVYPEKSGSLIPLVHAFYGIGASATPFLISQFLLPERPQDFVLPFLAFGALSFIALCVFAPVGEKLRPATPYADMTASKKRAAENPAEIFRYAKSWVLLLTAFLYTAFQTGLMAWMPTYCRVELFMDVKLSGLMGTLYFLGALLTRFLMPLVLKKMSPTTYLAAGGIASFVCMAAFLLADSQAAAIVLILLAGIFAGGYISALFVYANRSFPERTASASSVVVLAISLALLVAPFVMGRIAENASYFLSLACVTAALLVSALMNFALKAMDKKRPVKE